MFRVNGSLLLALPFPRPGPDERGSPTLPVLWRRYDFPPAHPRSLIGFASGAHAVLPRFVSRRSAPEPPEGVAQAGSVVPRRPTSGCSARGRERDLTGFLAIHPVSLPWSQTPAESPAPRPGGAVDAAAASNAAKASALT